MGGGGGRIDGSWLKNEQNRKKKERKKLPPNDVLTRRLGTVEHRCGDVSVPVPTEVEL